MQSYAGVGDVNLIYTDRQMIKTSKTIKGR